MVKKKTRFIFQPDRKIVSLTTTAAVPTPTMAVTVRSVSLGPLGFPILPTLPPLPPLPDIGSLNPLPAVATTPLLAAAGFLPLWFLIGGLWSVVTSLATSNLRTELESLSFLFMPQSNSLLLTKTAVEEAGAELDKFLANIVMGIKRKSYGEFGKQEPGILDGLLQGAMLALSLVSGPLQLARHLLGMLILKIAPDSRTMGDYQQWLDNISAGDKRASKYLMQKQVQQPGSEYTQNFPNFANQFEGV
jgi:hypothetical protein